MKRALPRSPGVPWECGLPARVAASNSGLEARAPRKRRNSRTCAAGEISNAESRSCVGTLDSESIPDAALPRGLEGLWQSRPLSHGGLALGETLVPLFAVSRIVLGSVRLRDAEAGRGVERGRAAGSGSKVRTRIPSAPGGWGTDVPKGCKSG